MPEIPESEFLELIAREAADETDPASYARLGELCALRPDLAEFRARFTAIIRSASSDDTADAPGPSLHRAYAIMRRELESREARQGPLSILKLVYDSLRPVPGLRSSAGTRRQIMLEEGDITADLFIDRGPAGFTLSVMVEGDEPSAITALQETSSTDLTHREGEWRCALQPGEVRLEIQLSKRVLQSEPFEIA